MAIVYTKKINGALKYRTGSYPDADNGTAGSLQAASNAAGAGGTLYIFPGMYSGLDISGSLSAGFSINGAGQTITTDTTGDVVIDGASIAAKLFIVNANNVTINIVGGFFVLKNSQTNQRPIEISSRTGFNFNKIKFLDNADNAFFGASTGIIGTLVLEGVVGAKSAALFYGVSTISIDFLIVRGSAKNGAGPVSTSTATGAVITIKTAVITGSYRTALSDGSGAIRVANLIATGNGAGTYGQYATVNIPTVDSPTEIKNALITRPAFAVTTGVVHASATLTNCVSDKFPFFASAPWLDNSRISVQIDYEDFDHIDKMAVALEAVGGRLSVAAVESIFNTSTFPQNGATRAAIEARMRELASRGHRFAVHTRSHTDLMATTAFDLSYYGSGTNPTAALSVAEDGTGTLTLTTTEGTDNVTFSFGSTSNIRDFVASSAKIAWATGPIWVLRNISSGNTAAAPYYSTSYLRMKSLQPFVATALSGTPKNVTVMLNISGGIASGFLKDELVDWKAELESIVGHEIKAFVMPRAVVMTDAYADYLKSAGYTFCRESTNWTTGSTSYDVRKINTMRVTSFNGPDFLPAASNEDSTRKIARSWAAVMAGGPKYLCLYWHGVDTAELSLSQYQWFLDELKKCGVNFATLEDMAATLSASPWSVSLSTGARIAENYTMQPYTKETLGKGSPCIRSGVDVGLTTDADGNTIPTGAGFDIGPYFYRPEVDSGYSAWCKCDGATPVDGQVFKSHALPISAKKVTVFTGVATAAQIGEAKE